MNRRTALLGAGGTVAIAASGAAGFALWSGGSKESWREAVHASRDPIKPGPTGQDALHELVRYATLAANSHNTQAWRFEVEPATITLLPDLARRTPTVDPDDHHLFASLGAATENIVQAAPLLGLSALPRFDADGDGRIVVALSPGAVKATPMAEAIPKRQCARSLYDGQPIPTADLEAVGAAARALLCCSTA